MLPKFVAATAAIQTTGITHTFSHTVAAGNNRILVVCVSFRNMVSSVTGVTYNGVALTQGARGSNTDRNTDIWYLVNPATGANDVVVTYDLDPADQVSGAANFTGVSQVTPVASADSNIGNNTNPTLSLAATPTQLIVAVGATYPGGGSMTPLTPGTGTTEMWEDDSNAGGSGNIQGFAGYEAGAGGATVIDWTHPSTGDTWSMSGLVLNPV